MSQIIPLNEFIKQTLQQIDQGIHQARCGGWGAILVAPRVIQVAVHDKEHESEEVTTALPSVQSVEFDLTVTVEAEEVKTGEAKGGGGVKVGVFSLEAGKSGQTEARATNSAVQNIKFSIPFVITDGGKRERFETNTKQRVKEIDVSPRGGGSY